MALVEIDSVSKNYQLGEVQVTALRNVTLKIATAAFVSFVGPSGSGKTTMLNLIGCLDKPSEGKIVVDGRQINTLNRKQGAVFEVQSWDISFKLLTCFRC